MGSNSSSYESEPYTHIIIFFNSILVLSCHLRQRGPSGLSYSEIPTKLLQALGIPNFHPFSFPSFDRSNQVYSSCCVTKRFGLNFYFCPKIHKASFIRSLNISCNGEYLTYKIKKCVH